MTPAGGTHGIVAMRIGVRKRLFPQ
jgi:hypothetical protein